ncbi:MAG: hypothetical protein L3J43_09875 [Sulfurovum sp.]|nr:hypothetical protein [Sulfurovum sp.]
MQEALATIQNDSTMMLIAGMAIAVLLAIVLVVVISSMRVKSYKDRFQNLLLELKEKSDYIETLEKEAKASRAEDTKNKKELASFDETKAALKKAKAESKVIDTAYEDNKKKLEKTKSTLSALEKKHDRLEEAHTTLKAALETSLEENSKLRTSNARLLMKLEKEVAQALQEHGKK